MADFLTTQGVSYRIENIIMEAQKELTLVSPFLQISKTFYERLKDASSRKVKIRIIYGKDDLKQSEKNSLANLNNVELFFFENLHAKCYFNEEDLVITSMNMYEFSEKNNREMGVYINKSTDPILFQKATDEAISIIKSSKNVKLKLINKTSNVEKNPIVNNNTFNHNTWHQRGYCIRCGSRIPYDTEKPFCLDCYIIWSQYENTEYPEAVCHECGEHVTTYIHKPLCYYCFSKTF